MHITSVRNFDSINVANAVFIEYITLPLRGNPLHIVCDITADRQYFHHHLPHAHIQNGRVVLPVPSVYNVFFFNKNIRDKKEKTHQNGSDILQDLFIFTVSVRMIAFHRH
jgi:hypothetical protein